MTDKYIKLNRAEKVITDTIQDKKLVEYILRQFEERAIIPNDKTYKHIWELAEDINPVEIASHIESDNLGNWCNAIRSEIQRTIIRLEKEQ